MRVAALYDVHGNVAALEAVLAEVEAEGIDVVVSGGDLAGPFAAECVDRLESLGDRVRFILGNADADAPWPLTTVIEVDGLGRVLFCHGSPRSNEEILTRVSPDERVRAALEGVDAAVVVCGHTHVQFDRVVDGRRLVNAGSVGMPYEGRRGAFWALLGPAVDLRQTDYDVEAAAAAIEGSAPDHADWLRNPQDPGEVTAYFEEQARGG